MSIIIIITCIIIVNEHINVAFSPKTSRTRNKDKENSDVFGRWKHRQWSRSRRHQYDVANKYVFKCRLKVDSDVADVTNDQQRPHYIDSVGRSL